MLRERREAQAFLRGVATRSGLIVTKSTRRTGLQDRFGESSFLVRACYRSVFQEYVHRVARLFPDCSAYVRLYGQHVRAVAHSHKRALKWMTVNCASDLNETMSSKKLD